MAMFAGHSSATNKNSSYDFVEAISPRQARGELHRQNC